MEKEKKDRTKKKKEYNRLDFLVKNTMLFTISSFGSKLLSFFLVPLYTNILSTYEYGTIDLVSTTRNLLSYMLTICIADAVLRFVMDKTSKNTQILTFGITCLSTFHEPFVSFVFIFGESIESIRVYLTYYSHTKRVVILR